MHEALEMLAAVVDRYPEAIHPQLVIDGERDPAVRANSLAALGDPEGLLSDIRGIVVSSNTASRLTVRDVERACAVPRPTDALPYDSVRLQLDDLHAQGHPAVLALADAAVLLRRIDRWGRHHLGDEAPDLQLVLRLLGLFEAKAAPTAGVDLKPAAPAETMAETQTLESPAAAAHADPAPLPMQADPTKHAPTTIGPAGVSLAQQREQVRSSLIAARAWLEQCEPSSPAAILLKQAERVLGKRFAEVAQVIPADLLAKWDAD